MAAGAEGEPGRGLSEQDGKGKESRTTKGGIGRKADAPDAFWKSLPGLLGRMRLVPGRGALIDDVLTEALGDPRRQIQPGDWIFDRGYDIPTRELKQRRRG